MVSKQNCIIAGILFSCFNLIVSYASENSAQSSPAKSESYQAVFAHARARNYDEAIKFLQEWNSSQAASVESFLWIADYYRYAGKVKEGISYLQKNPANDSQQANRQIALARLFAYGDKWKSAFAAARKAIELGSESPEAVRQLVQAAINSEQTEDLAKILGNLKKAESQAPLYNIGYAIWHFDVKKYESAQSTVAKCLSDGKYTAFVEEILGDILSAQSKYSQAIRAYNEAQRLSRDSNVRQHGRVLLNLSLCYFSTGKTDSALACGEGALALASSTGDLLTEWKMAIAISRELRKRELFAQMKGVAKVGIAAARLLGTEAETASLYQDLALCETMQGNIEQALLQYETAHRLSRDLAQQSQISFEMGKLLVVLGKTGQALTVLERAQKQAESADKPNLQYEALFQMAEITIAQGERYKAKRMLEKVLRYGQRTQQHLITEKCFIKLAHLFLQSKPELNSAHYYLAMADALSRQVSELSFAANHRWLQGNAALIENDIEQAETYFLDAIQLGGETGSYLAYLAGQAGLIRTYLSADFPELARAHADTALAYLDKYYLFCRDEFWAAYLDLKNDLFTPAIIAYSLTGDLVKIYQVCEKYKALQNINSLAQLPAITGNREIRAPVEKLRKMQENVRNAWKLLWSKKYPVIDSHNGTRATIEGFHNQIDDIFKRMRAENPEIYELFKPSTLDFPVLQERLRKLGSAYIHYFVSSNATFALVIQSGGIYCKRINISEEYLGNLVTELAPGFKPSGDLPDVTFSKPTEFRLDHAGQLYKLLIEPLEEWLGGIQMLMISADGLLNCLPFDLLVTNPEHLIDRYDYTNAEFLVQRYATCYVPFSSFLELPDHTRQGDKLMLLMSNSTNMGASDNGANKKTPKQNSSSNGVGPKESSELEGIWQALGRRQVSHLRGQAATKANFLTQESEYRIIHLAIPGTLDERAPLGSSLIFSGEPLSVHELFEQSLGAEMAVLTHCKRIFDDGRTVCNAMTSLLRGFSFAGIPCVLSSQWTTSEDSPEFIFEHFYNNLKLGLNKAEALRQAKVAYLKEGNRNPYYWANTVLYGSSAAMKFEEKQTYLLVYMTILGLLLLITLFVRQFHKFLKERH